MIKINGKRVLKSIVVIVLALGMTTPALANSLPTSGGLYIAQGSGTGVFYSFAYIATNIPVVQDALNNAGGMTNVYLDIGGQITNFGQFVTSEASTGISNATFTLYAQSHTYIIPGGITVYSASQGQYQYNAAATVIPVNLPAKIMLSSTNPLTAGSNATTTVTATVYDASGQVIPNETVNWTSSNSDVGTIVASSITNSSGVASATISVGNVVGVSQISASAGGITSLPVTFTSLATVSSSTPASPTAMLNLYQPNTDQNDTTYWQRANPSFYLSAQTYDPSVTTSGPSLLNLGTGQSVYLFAYSNQRNVNNTGLTWLVNSSDAQIATGSSGWTSGNYQVAEGDFMATQPGIYTVQADENGTYSMPLVLVVGMSKLSSASAAVTPDQMGIQSLPSTLPVITPTTQAGVTYAQYSAQGNWIPISGSTMLGVSNMNVILDGANGQEWDYRLPVVNGTFSGMVESPFTGQVTVTLFPHYFQTMTQLADTNATSYYYPASSYTVNVSGVSLSTQAQAVLASAHRDYNLSPQFATVASTLLENSPSMETAMAAISNDASESIAYNQNELQTVNYVWQDVLTAWNTHSGVCEDFSSLAAAMMQSVGIPTQTVGGWANQDWTTPPATDTNPVDAHQWDQAWDGSGWLVFDPTWNTDDTSSTSNYITNEFFTNTTSFAAVHLADPTQTGLDLSLKKGRN